MRNKSKNTKQKIRENHTYKIWTQPLGIQRLIFMDEEENFYT